MTTEPTPKEVQEIATTLELERSDRARDLAESRHKETVKLAEERGAETALVKNQLESHEARLNKINGSIDRNNRALDAVKEGLHALLTEKKAIINLQSKQIALVGALGAIGYILITLLH